MSQFNRDHTWKCDKSKYLSNKGTKLTLNDLKETLSGLITLSEE